MQTYEILVQNRAIRANSNDMTLVRTSVGIDVLHVLFDSEEWLGFPVTITFAQGEDVITQSLLLSGIDDSEWVAEAECVIPHEVIDMTGAIRVTIQGTDANGRHIITAKGSPLSVEESGDVITGEPSSDVPTLDQWNQAYAQAIQAATDARTVADNFQQRINAVIAAAEEEISGLMELNPATSESLGLVQIGDGVSVTDDGVISVPSSDGGSGMTQQQLATLVNLSRLAYQCFDTEFDGNGLLKDGATLKASQLPRASLGNLGTMMPDGTTITIDEDGMIHGGYFYHSWNGSVLTIESMGGVSSADLVGPSPNLNMSVTVDQTIGTPSATVEKIDNGNESTFTISFSGIKGEKGDKGDTGPSGYVLTQEDIETISAEIVASYPLFDDGEF